MERDYRITVIFDSRDQQESGEEMLQRVAELMANLGARVDEAKYLGQKDFARCARRDFRSAGYGQYRLAAMGSFGDELKKRLRLDKTVDRLLIERI